MLMLSDNYVVGPIIYMWIVAGMFSTFSSIIFSETPNGPKIDDFLILTQYGNSVRFLAKIPNGTAAESPCYSVFWNAIDFCRLYTPKQISMWALLTVPLFAGKYRLFTRNVPLKTFSKLAGLLRDGVIPALWKTAHVIPLPKKKLHGRSKKIFVQFHLPQLFQRFLNPL